MKRRKLLNLANALTVSRMAAAPALLWMVLRLRPPGTADGVTYLSLACCILFVLTVVTDLLDGLVARHYGVVTDFGKIMDPVADSTLFMTLLFGLTAAERFRLPVWIPMLVLWREIGMHVLRRYAALRGKVLAAKFSGKLKMVLQCVCMIGFFLLLAASDLGLARLTEARLGAWLYACGVVIAAVNVLSLAEYLREVPLLVREWHGEADLEDEG